MKSIIQLFVVLFAFSLFSSTVSADSPTPSQDMVCDILHGGTPGLFGLCNAFCEAKNCDEEDQLNLPRSCDRLLNNYNNRMESGDPEMPCLVQEPPPPPEFECPCWTLDNLATVGMMFEDNLVTLNNCGTPDPFLGGSTFASFSSGAFNFSVTAVTGFAFCSAVGGTSGFTQLTDPEDIEGCIGQVVGLQEMYFIPNGFTCD